MSVQNCLKTGCVVSEIIAGINWQRLTLHIRPVEAGRLYAYTAAGIRRVESVAGIRYLSQTRHSP